MKSNEMRKWRLGADDKAGDTARDKVDKLQKIKQEIEREKKQINCRR